MELHHLQTFLTVAREGTITRASELLHLSQPAVSAHIKALEELLGIALFERTARGMSLTAGGQRLLPKAEATLRAHQALMEESSRIKGQLRGKLRIGASGSMSHEPIRRLLSGLALRYPEVEAVVKHGSSAEIQGWLRTAELDVGYYNQVGAPEPELETLEVSRFKVHLVAPRGRLTRTDPPDWKALGELPWVYPVSSACCGQVAERLFKTRQIRPKRIVSVDREEVSKTLIAGGIGIGLLHEGTAEAAEARGELDLLFTADDLVKVRFGYLKSRAEDPLLEAAASILRDPE
ncbi:MAG: LysR family transcriptional regulator [Myxococcota bacterium]